MSDAECVALLQWALPRLGRRWAGYRKVRGQVCKRIRRRIAELELGGFAHYRARLERQPGEWEVLDDLLGVTISRFYRDRGMWEALHVEVLPELAGRALAAGEPELWCWSAGCASGEEPYTLSIVWTLELAGRFPGVSLRVLATDVDPQLLERARAAEYEAGSLRELPPAWRDRAFERRGDRFHLRDRFRAAVELRRHDVRDPPPKRSFRLIACRNLVCTYFDEPSQVAILEGVLSRLAPGGALLVGAHERPPPGVALAPWYPSRGIYRSAES